MDPSDIETICAIAREAGAAIMKVYAGQITIDFKDDRSPLTAADRAAHEVISKRLAESSPHRPILSEEGREIPFEVRRHWDRFWLVDPLDGTKEFIKRNGDFTVNIALVEKGVSVFGVIYAPALKRLYWGMRGKGAWLQEGTGEPIRIRPRPQKESRGLTVVKSRSHPSPELEAYLKTLPVAEAIEVGSSLKMCAVAEGRADLYARFGPTMEWDTAAGQAIVEGAGGTMIDREGRPLRYNKPDLHNPYFIARA